LRNIPEIPYQAAVFPPSVFNTYWDSALDIIFHKTLNPLILLAFLIVENSVENVNTFCIRKFIGDFHIKKLTSLCQVKVLKSSAFSLSFAICAGNKKRPFHCGKDRVYF